MGQLNPTNQEYQIIMCVSSVVPSHDSDSTLNEEIISRLKEAAGDGSNQVGAATGDQD